MKTITLKGQIRKVEQEISLLNQSIAEKTFSLSQMKLAGKQTSYRSVYIDSISKEELAENVLSGVSLCADYDGRIYFDKEFAESDEEFNRRIECQVKSIAGLEAKKEKLKVVLEDLKELKRKEEEIYKNPEYIQYLKLRKKFEDV